MFNLSILIILNIIVIRAGAQINFDTRSTCSYEGHGQQARLNSRLWNVSYGNEVVLFRLCGTNLQYAGIKDSKALIYDKRKPRDLRGAGSYFEVYEKFYVNATLRKRTRKKKPPKLPLVLSSQGGSICSTNPVKRYALIITIDMEVVDKEEIKVNEIRNCSYNITIKPNVEPYCTRQYKGNVIDLRNFENIEYQFQSDNGLFAVALCGTAPSCKNEDVSACQIANGTISPIADFNQDITYSNGRVIVKSKWESMKLKLRTIYNINCKWNVNGLQGKYMKPPTQGSNYKFELYSKQACVKYPMECLLRDAESYLYDLRGLNKANGWKVQNVSDGTFFINICGLLSRRIKKCTDQYSQACYYNSNTTLNYGSVLENLLVRDDVVEGKLIGGDDCPSNNNLTLSTRIFFECSFKELGPMIMDTHNCSIDILWRTPKACPQYKNQFANCLVNDVYGKRDLNALYDMQADRYRTIDKTTRLRYNVCGKLLEPCNNESEVSACLHEGGKEYVLGYLRKDVVVDHTSLTMNLTGDYCKDKSYKRNVLMNFVCDYAEHRMSVSQLKILEDSCSYALDIRTLSACYSDQTTSCIAQTQSHPFNLTALALNDRNYVLNNKNFDFIINVCNPIVPTDDVLCPAQAGACLRNNTEPNLKKRFVSFGKPYNFLVDGKQNVSFNFLSGKLCKETMFDRRTTVRFVCSKDTRMELREKNKCTYEILWSTDFMCSQRTPRNKLTCIHQSNTHKSIDLSDVDQKKLNVNLQQGTLIMLDLCQETYINETKGYVAYETKSISMQLIEDDNKRFHLRYDLKQSCNDKDRIVIEIHLLCDSSDQDRTAYNLIDENDCVYKIALKSTSLCDPLSHASHSRFRDCLVGQMEAARRFNLMSLGPLKVDNTSIELAFAECPAFGYDCDSSTVRFSYVDYGRKCLDDFYTYEICLRCNASFEIPSIKNVSTCSSRIVYPLTDACSMLECRTYTAGIVSGIVVGLAVSMGIFVACYMYYRRNKKCYKSFPKENTPIYTRNTTL